MKKVVIFALKNQIETYLVNSTGREHKISKIEGRNWNNEALNVYVEELVRKVGVKSVEVILSDDICYVSSINIDLEDGEELEQKIKDNLSTGIPDEDIYWDYKLVLEEENNYIVQVAGLGKRLIHKEELSLEKSSIMFVSPMSVLLFESLRKYSNSKDIVIFYIFETYFFAVVIDENLINYTLVSEFNNDVSHIVDFVMNSIVNTSDRTYDINSNNAKIAEYINTKYGVQTKNVMIDPIGQLDIETKKKKNEDVINIRIVSDSKKTKKENSATNMMPDSDVADKSDPKAETKKKYILYFVLIACMTIVFGLLLFYLTRV